MIATAGVLVFGAIQAILLVVVLALLRFIRLTARPRVEILGELADGRGYRRWRVILPRGRSRACCCSATTARSCSSAHHTSSARCSLLPRQRAPTCAVRDRPAAGQPDRRDGLFAIRDAFDTLRRAGIVVAAAGRDTEWA